MRSLAPRYRFMLAFALLIVVVLAAGDVTALAFFHASRPAAPASGPVTITLTAEADAGIESPQHDQALGLLSYLPAYYLGQNEYGRSLLFFNLAGQLPADAIVDSATLYLYLSYATNPDPVGLTAKAVQAEWSEPRVTWDTRPAVGNPTYTNLLVDGVYPAYKGLDVTGIVIAWQTSNFGLELSGPEGGANGYRRVFNSREAADNPPQLQITYHLPPPPPGTWSGFSPADWATSLAPTCAVQVQLPAGLAPATAQYRYSNDGGSTWSAWTAAACTGHSGSTLTQVVTAGSVPFGQNSLALDRNRIAFRVQDTAANWETSPTYNVYIDAMPPAHPTGLGADRPTGAWSNSAAIVLSWNAATDAPSGVKGYSYQWSAEAGTLPDATMDTAALSVAGAIPGQGSNWYFHVRSVDNAGNWSVGAAHLGPFRLDVTPPSNPTTLFSGSHTANAWSNNNLVTCQWSGAGDDLSGIAGYSYAWDHSPTTVPDATVDTSFVVVTSPALADAADWYCHVRTIDQAGNAAAGAAHAGPFRIDTWPPASWVLTLNPVQDRGQFPVSWEGFADTGAPIVGYDVKVVDQVGGSVTSSQWQSGTAATSAVFTNAERGHTYYFTSRARDAAGNQEAYPTPPDAYTSVGVPTQVRVRDEWGNPRPGAKVYHDGRYAGLTDAQGRLALSHVLVGDPIVALYRVYEHPSPRTMHEKDGGGSWNWRVYQTNLSFNAAGAPQPHLIAQPALTQEITVYRNRPLIGVHLVVSVQWDATATYLEALQYGLRNASDFLYDITDGQMFWEVIEVFDNEARQKVADMFVVASGGRAQAGVGEIESATGRMVIYRPFVLVDPSGGNPGLDGDSRVMVHEFGHYGLHLDDEYRDRTGAEGTGAFCASNLNSVTIDRRASIMNNQGISSELCSKVDPNHRHMTETAHDASNSGESTWETVLRRYKSSHTPALWTLTSPDTRGAAMPGPEAVPVPAWTTIYVTDVGPGACPPFTVTATSIVDDKPLPAVTVYVVYAGTSGADTGLTWLPQGTTDGAGQMLIVGAHNGDLIVAVAPGKLGLIEVAGCADGGSPLSAAGEAEVTAQLVMQPQPFDLSVSVEPLDAATLEVTVKAMPPLPSAPLAALRQDGAEQPIAVALSYDAGLGGYTGRVTLDPALASAGYVAVYARDAAGREMWQHRPFDLSPVAAGGFVSLYSPDGRLGLVFLPGTLAAGAQVAILQDVDTGAPPPGLVPVGPAYRAMLLDGPAELAGNATINLHYEEDSLAGADPTTVQLYRWDDAAGWSVVPGSRHSPADRVVSASVSRLGVYALFARPAAAPGLGVCLPLVCR